jgi:DNA-binding CsgD family transcriptional regulator
VQVRGITVQARKAVITRQFGAEAWAGLFRDIAGAHACFRAPLTANNLIPLPAYLAFHDEIMRRFFRDDDSSNLLLGAESARWTFSDGPYRSFLEKQAIHELVAGLPGLWRMFFAETTAHSEATLEGNTVNFRVFDLPETHRYFEPFIIGHTKETLEMFCANPVVATRIARAGGGYHYAFHLGPPAPPDASAAPPESAPPESIDRTGRSSLRDRAAIARQSERSLSDREAEVLVLLGEGQTNKEIGSALGISGKTVQHHITRLYHKLGVSGRVAATTWLAQHGVVGR